MKTQLSQAVSLLEKVEQYLESIKKTYIPKDVKVNITHFNDIGDGIDFKFTMPNSSKHNFVPNFRITSSEFGKVEDEAFHDYLLLQIGKNLIYEIGNYEIDEAYDISFCKRNHYGKRQLEFLHQDEDQLLESAQAMLIGARFSEYDRTVDRNYGLLAPFTGNQVKLIKVIYKTITKYFGLKISDITFRGFTSAFKDGKYQQASLAFMNENMNHEFVVNIFSNQVRKYSEMFAKHGFGEEETIYFIIKTYLKKAINEFDPAKEANTSEDPNVPLQLDKLIDTKQSFNSVINKFPKRFYEMMDKD